MIAACFGDPGIDALVVALGGHRDRAVQLRRDAHHETTGKGLVGRFAPLGAESHFYVFISLTLCPSTVPVDDPEDNGQAAPPCLRESAMPILVPSPSK